MESRRRSAGLTALGGFFLFGAAMSGLAGASLLWPGGALEPIWRLNPEARVALGRMGPWAALLMLAVCVACGLAARGLSVRAPWGRRLAIGVLAVNFVGDGANVLLRGDLRTLIGLPIGAALIAYLASGRVRAEFETSPREREARRTDPPSA